MIRTLLTIFLLLFCLPAHAAGPALERFTGPPPAMMLAEQTADPQLAVAFAGGWGYSSDDACRLLVPKDASGLLSAYAGSAQELVVFVRLSLECGRAGLAPKHLSRIARTIYSGPQGSLYEHIEVELLALDKDQAAKLDGMNLPAEGYLDYLNKNADRYVREFWFDITDIRNHNAGVLYGMTYKPRAVSSHGVAASKLVKAPELLQRSVYLEISPKEYLTAIRDEDINPALVDGGWGYDQASALVQHLPKGEKDYYQDFIGLQLQLVSLRNILEFAQLSLAGERLQPVAHDKRRQALITPENGKKYDQLIVDVYLVPTKDYEKARTLMNDPKPEAQAALRAMAQKVEREFWFDVTEPFDHNGALITGEGDGSTPKKP